MTPDAHEIYRAMGHLHVIGDPKVLWPRLAEDLDDVLREDDELRERVAGFIRSVATAHVLVQAQRDEAVDELASIVDSLRGLASLVAKEI